MIPLTRTPGPALAACALVLAGCAGPRVLMPTPSIYVDPGSDAFAEVGIGVIGLGGCGERQGGSEGRGEEEMSFHGVVGVHGSAVSGRTFPVVKRRRGQKVAVKSILKRAWSFAAADSACDAGTGGMECVPTTKSP